MIKFTRKILSVDNLLVAIAIAFFFCMNQYNGIVVDAILYTLQAVNFVHPERFVNDVSFMYGNQDAFTIFSPLYVAFINLFGVSNGALLLCLISQTFFAISVSYLMCSWYSRFHCKKIFFPALVLFFALYRFGELRSIVYSFNLIEPYVVPRTFSVALAVLGLGSIYFGKKKSLVFIVLGMLFNPLMAGWALPLWLFFYYPRLIFPIVVCCAFFPLTIFLGIGPFSRFDSKWLLTSPEGPYLARFAAYGLFYLWGYCSFRKAFLLKKIFRALTFVWGIAFYWYVIAKTTHHVFLNQAQIFRIEWLCVTTTFILMIIVFVRLYTFKFRKKIFFFKLEYLFFAFPLLFWIDSIFVDCCYIYVLIRIKGFRLKTIDGLNVCLRIFVLLIFASIGFIELFRIVDISLFDEYQIKEYVRLLGFVGAITIGGMYLEKIYSKRKAFVLLILLATAIFSFTILQYEQKSIAEVAVLAMLTMVWIHPIQSLRKRFLLMPFLWLVPYVIVHYDTRTEVQVNAEKQAELFWDESIFPSVTNRGRILFVTSGFHNIQPRFQFLTGAYIDDQSFPGGLLFREQFIEASHRLSMLFFEQKNMPSQYEYRDFPREIPEYWDVLYNADSLKSRFSFLCSHNEIKYLVTDVNLDNENVADSYKFPKTEWKINLYQCP